MKLRTEFTCPLEMTHDIIKGKWKPLIVWQLQKHGCSLSQLKRMINGISTKVLVQQLHELQEYGIIDKECTKGYPLKSHYSLSARGYKLYEAVSILQSIGIEIMLEDHREAFLQEKGLL